MSRVIKPLIFGAAAVGSAWRLRRAVVGRGARASHSLPVAPVVGSHIFPFSTIPRVPITQHPDCAAFQAQARRPRGMSLGCRVGVHERVEVHQSHRRRARLPLRSRGMEPATIFCTIPRVPTQRPPTPFQHKPTACPRTGASRSPILSAVAQDCFPACVSSIQPSVFCRRRTLCVGKEEAPPRAVWQGGWREPRPRAHGSASGAR